MSSLVFVFMNQSRRICSSWRGDKPILALLIALSLLTVACRQVTAPPQSARKNSEAPKPVATVRAEIGFASRQKFLDHYDKHRNEFGSISKEDYLRQAQELRDRAAENGVLEVLRSDGVITRFDKKTGAFLAFNDDLTIRTYFKPNDGEAYFHRQSKRGSSRGGNNE
ncbi:MAG: hypothetical protein ACKVZH_12935 [Blastocatellia bacterium]